MKILYGVQGTGNGHITRARTMANALAEVGAEVDWIFSGRAKDKYFDMDVFGEFQALRGLTFVIERGRVLFPQTLLRNNVLQLYRDIRALNVDHYDLVLTDFEPITAWAARLAGKKVIGISHQCAFLHDIPKRGSNPFVSWFMRNFAPADQPIGLHWHHFNQPILPPLVEQSYYMNEVTPDFYLVYLPFMDLGEIISKLQNIHRGQFAVYHHVSESRTMNRIKICPFSRSGFQRDLHRCAGVICNAGFELTSEAIQLGKKLLVKPVKGQMEQQSNALALTELGLGHVTHRWTERVINDWLAKPQPKARPYPDVARALVAWLQKGAVNFEELHQSLWQNMPLPADLEVSCSGADTLPAARIHSSRV